MKLKAEPAVAVAGALTVKCVAAPVRLVRLKFAEPGTPVAVATTL